MELNPEIYDSARRLGLHIEEAPYTPKTTIEAHLGGMPRTMIFRNNDLLIDYVSDDTMSVEQCVRAFLQGYACVYYNY